MASGANDDLRRSVERLLESQPDDQRLRDHLEGLARLDAFPGLTCFWGPLLYARNRVLFRALILDRFSEWGLEGRRWKRVKWDAHADRLEPWLEKAREHRDTPMVRRLLRWKLAGSGWGIDRARYNAALLADYLAAPSPAARAIVLDEYDDWFELLEDTALSLYEADARVAPFVLRHLPAGFFGENKRRLWSRLHAAAQARGDDELSFALYRKQISPKQWHNDVLALAAGLQDRDELDRELRRRHPEGYGLKLGDGLLALLQARGRDVMPYVMSKLSGTVGGYFGASADPLIKFAKREGYWDLWAGAVRAGYRPDAFNKAVSELLSDGSLDEEVRVARLSMLAGVSREWNWTGLGLALIHPLEDKIARELYLKHPRLLHRAFKAHVTPTWWKGYPRLLEAAQGADDRELVDLLASRYATRCKSSWAGSGSDELLRTADELAGYYEAIRERDAVEFARRAANVLTRMPAYSIHAYRRTLETNRLARLLFVRSMDAMLEDSRGVQDLVEASDIHVQLLAYRILARDDPRARALAGRHLELLLGTLLRPLHRKTRIPAFDALLNAAREDPDAARRVLERAREALRLPDRRYPKEELVGLIGRVLQERPELRSEREQPVVYGLSRGAPP